MEKKSIIRVRISPELNDKIKEAALKKKMKKSRYVRMQTEQSIPFLQSNLDIVQRILQTEIKDAGFKINIKARMFNTYGAIEVDEDLEHLLRYVIHQLEIVWKLLNERGWEKNETEKLSFQFEDKRKNVNLTFAVSQALHQSILKSAEENHTGMSRYVRYVLENPSKYTKQDIRILRQRVHLQIYPIVSNVEQICFRYAESSIRNIVPEIQKINALSFEISRLENDIMRKLEL